MAVAQASGELEEPQKTLLPVHGSLERSQSIVEFAPPTQQTSQDENRNESDGTSSKQRQPSSPWRLRSAVSEVILLLVLPFLQLQVRVDCRRVCCVWKHIVRDWGVATTIDSNDKNITNFSRPFLRGILLHSYSSLHSLVLDGFESLQHIFANCNVWICLDATFWMTLP
jgi:putative heme iron utilization protein